MSLEIKSCDLDSWDFSPLNYRKKINVKKTKPRIKVLSLGIMRSIL